MTRKIRFFGQVSLAIYAYFRLMEQLGLPKTMTHVWPADSKRDIESPRVIIENKIPREPFVVAVFYWEPKPLANPPVPGLTHVHLIGDSVEPSRFYMGQPWQREFAIGFPDDPEIPEFAPSGRRAIEILTLSQEQRVRDLRRYFESGAHPPSN